MSTPTKDVDLALRRLSDLGERRIVKDVLEPRYRSVSGFGDDCAPFGSEHVITTDSCSRALVASLGMDDLVHTGWLLATMNLSDLAAAGAEPDALVVNYTLPRETPVSNLVRIMDGVDACAATHGTRVVGGDLGEGSELRLCATAVGHCPPRLTPAGSVATRLSRRGAGHSDRLLLIGSPGYLWAAALLYHGYAEIGEDRETVYAKAREPVAQLKAGRMLAEHGLARAATDVSDGLFASVRNLCHTNALGAIVSRGIQLDEVLMEVCRQAEVEPFGLGQIWGDWSLVVAVAEEDAAAALELLDDAKLPARDIGFLTQATTQLWLTDDDGQFESWNGVDQERFSDTSWRGDGIEARLRQLRARTRN
ncbi:thiamine-phosphate kinase [Pseudonocardia eucalypti]|uniref:Thiamine-phosphate kinase n=1 Tax=Pseudonocardia eucalypti TaxID=648755 RepID=A0ABP9QST5_9PSEU|nr:thiamine-monophosphate kinase [Pseudonocardia eucalypti]